MLYRSANSCGTRSERVRPPLHAPAAGGLSGACSNALQRRRCVRSRRAAALILRYSMKCSPLYVYLSTSICARLWRSLPGAALYCSHAFVCYIATRRCRLVHYSILDTRPSSLARRRLALSSTRRANPRPTLAPSSSTAHRGLSACDCTVVWGLGGTERHTRGFLTSHVSRLSSVTCKRRGAACHTLHTETHHIIIDPGWRTHMRLVPLCAKRVCLCVIKP